MGRREAYITTELNTVGVGLEFDSQQYEITVTQTITDGLSSVIGRNVHMDLSVEQAERLRDELTHYIALAKEYQGKINEGATS